MKKLFALILVLVCLNTKAQTWVTIPDANFASYLQSIIPAAMNGNQMDTSNTLVTTNTYSINVANKGIVNLFGVQYFSSLTYLKCDSNILVSLPNLPSSLKFLSCNNNSLNNLPQLPISLQTLSCATNSLTTLPNLPVGLTHLSCTWNSLASLPSLPTSLLTLSCRQNLLTTLPTLPNSLKIINCYGNQIDSLPMLPDSLTILDCEANYIDPLPNLPNSLVYLNCANNFLLRSLPPLPNSLKTLYCQNNNISCFPFFPSSITDLALYINPFNCLPNYIPAMYSDTLAYPLCGVGNSNGCAVATGISQISGLNSKVSIYPNPSNGIFQITVNNEQLTEMKIFDVKGKLVFSQSINGNTTINASSLNEGVYNVSITSSESSLHKRIVIIK